MTFTTLCHPELVSGSHQPEMLNIVDFIKSLFVKRFSMTYLKKALAFTLAETLVVMGIIGVVAALTIPNLNQSTGDREKVAKVKKIYANLEDAFGRATAIYGPIDEWYNSGSGSDKFLDRAADFMKVSKTCDKGTTGCFASVAYPFLDKGDEMKFSSKSYLLADGTAITLEENSKSCQYDDSEVEGDPSANVCARIFVDIDGVKGINTFGKDLFVFFLTKDGVVPSGTEGDNWGYDTNVQSNCVMTGLFCTGWIIRNDNMDYLKADRNSKCPNGTVLSWENTSCK